MNIYRDPPHKILYPTLSGGCRFRIKHKIGGSTSGTSLVRTVYAVHASCPHWKVASRPSCGLSRRHYAYGWVYRIKSGAYPNCTP
eukprot:jgi/Botrbrau1/5565/Bobra.0023s0048.1